MSLTLETVLSKHNENDLLNQLIQKEKLIFIGAHEIHVLERSRDDDKTGVHRLIILFENLIVFSAPTGKDTFAHRAHLPLKKDAMTVFRISLGQLGLTLENRKFILTHRDFKRVGIVQNDSTIEKDLLNCLSHFRTIIGIEKESLLKELDHGFGYLQNLENVEYQERYFVNSRNEILFTPIYKQKSNARGLVFVVPGFGDTSPTLWSDFCLRRPIIESLLKKGFHVASIDHAGHGRSEGLPMFVSDFEQHLVGDVQAVINEAKKTLQTDKLPVFVYGESMGGNISLRLLLNGQASKSFAGGVLVAPMTQIGEDVKPPAWQVPLLRLASKVFPAAAIIPNKVETEGFKDPNDCVRCKQSPLSSPVDSIRLATADACMSACETLAPRFKELTTPFILIHGKSDTVIPLPFSQMLFDTAGSKEKVFKQYDDVYHCINAEEPKLLQPILNDIVEWLDARVKSIENEEDVNEN